MKRLYLLFLYLLLESQKQNQVLKLQVVTMQLGSHLSAALMGTKVRKTMVSDAKTAISASETVVSASETVVWVAETAVSNAETLVSDAETVVSDVETAVSVSETACMSLGSRNGHFVVKTIVSDVERVRKGRGTKISVNAALRIGSCGRSTWREH